MPSASSLRADLEAVLFDLDGVVIDSEPIHLRSKRLTFEAFGLHVPEAEFDAFYGRTDADVIGYVVRTYGPHLDAGAVLRHKQDVYAGLIDELPLVPDVDRFMERIAAEGLRTALVTSAAPRNQRQAFDKFGLDGRFELVLTAADVTHPKPHPEPYLRAVELLELPAATCLVIEDSVNGVRSARAAGCRVAGLTTSFSEAALRDAGARPVVGGYRELAQALGHPLG